MSDKIKLTIEVDKHDLSMLLDYINNIKDMNRTIDDRCEISYNHVCKLENADYHIARIFGFEQPTCEHGSRNWYANYTMTKQLQQKVARADK